MFSKEIKVGLLAYGAIGDEHNKAIQATAGLALHAVCDTNPERLTAALQISPDAQTFSDANEMLAKGGIDLVVISTPASRRRQAEAAAQQEYVLPTPRSPLHTFMRGLTWSSFALLSL